jgi:acetylornithine/LysW-gamma-L-lysine aminotransferase
MNEADIKEIENQYLANTYSKSSLVLTRGKGALVWDIQGQEYIDLMSGYGVALVGHCNPSVIKAISNQATQLITCHSSIYNEARAKFLDKLLGIAPSSMNRAFLSNSGAESVEASIKIARRYTERKEIIAMTGSYHGKTLGALTLTWTPRYREPFQPLIPEVKFANFGDSSQIREIISEKTAAIIVEPIQGETGIKLPPDGFLHELREICDVNDSLLIFDEIQTGLGRTGKMWASEHWKVQPDIMCVSKALAGGLPMGATLAREDIMNALKVGEHSCTFGGNPLSSSAASAVIDYIISEGLVERSEKIGKLFMKGLQRLAEEYKVIREARGLGLMSALELRFDIRNVLQEILNENVIPLYSGKNILRFLPPLVISDKQISRVLKVLDYVIEKEEKARLS